MTRFVSTVLTAVAGLHSLLCAVSFQLPLWVPDLTDISHLPHLNTSSLWRNSFLLYFSAVGDSEDLAPRNWITRDFAFSGCSYYPQQVRE